jgi:hypothetical protein
MFQKRRSQKIESWGEYCTGSPCGCPHGSHRHLKFQTGVLSPSPPPNQRHPLQWYPLLAPLLARIIDDSSIEMTVI